MEVHGGMILPGPYTLSRSSRVDKPCLCVVLVVLFFATTEAEADVSAVMSNRPVLRLLAKRKSRKKKKRKKPASSPPEEQSSNEDEPWVEEKRKIEKPELEDVPLLKDNPGQNGWKFQPGLHSGDQGTVAPTAGKPKGDMQAADSESAGNKKEIDLSATGGERGKNRSGDMDAIEQKNFLFDVLAGMLVQRGGRVDPGADLAGGWNLGKILGWPGLYLAARVDIFMGESPLGARYLLMDTCTGFMGRFPVGPVNLRAMLEFDARKMFITSQGPSGKVSPSLGLGVGLGADLDFALTRWMLILIGGSAKLLQDPLTGKFEFSAVARGGVGFVF